MEEVKTGVCDGPINDDFHLPDERDRPIDPKQHHSVPRCVPHESSLVGCLRVPILELEGRVGEVEYPKDIVDEKSCILRQLDSLLGRHHEASIDVKVNHQERVNHKLEGQGVLCPIPLGVYLAVEMWLSDPVIILAGAVEHPLDHHHEHESE